MFCKKCGEEAKGTFCVKCGYKISKTNILDSKLNVKTKGTNFCNMCGTKLTGKYCSKCSYNTVKSELTSKSSFTPMESAKPILKKVNSVVGSSTEVLKDNTENFKSKASETTGAIKEKATETSATIKEKATETTAHIKEDIAKYVELGKNDNIIYHILLALLIIVTTFNYVRFYVNKNLGSESGITYVLILLIVSYGAIYLNTHFRKKNIHISDVIFPIVAIYAFVYAASFARNSIDSFFISLLGLFFIGKMKTVKAFIAIKFEGTLISRLLKKLNNYNANIVISTFFIIISSNYYTGLIGLDNPTSTNIIFGLLLNYTVNVIMLVVFYMYTYEKISFKSLIFMIVTCSIASIALTFLFSGVRINDFTSIITYIYYGLILFTVVLIWYVITARDVYSKNE